MIRITLDDLNAEASAVCSKISGRLDDATIDISVSCDEQGRPDVEIRCSLPRSCSASQARSFHAALGEALLLSNQITANYIVDSDDDAWSSILDKAESSVAQDMTGVSYMSATARNVMKELLSHCRIERRKTDDYTKALVEYFVSFHPDCRGGSQADCVAYHCVRAIEGYSLSDADEEIRVYLASWIADRALYPERELGVLSAAGVEL